MKKCPASPLRKEVQIKTSIPGCGGELLLLLWSQQWAPGQQQQVQSTGHTQEQPAPNPVPPLYKQKVERGQEGAGIKVRLCYSLEVTFSLPGMREVLCLLFPSSTQPKWQRNFTENHPWRMKVLTDRTTGIRLSA